ncbi:unnamed protein product [Closterium sp. NIES-54]
MLEAAALDSSESAAAPGAGESAAALGAHESTDTLGASASTATGPALAEALHTLTLDSGASRCFFCLHLPAFSTNLLSNAVLQDEWVDNFIPGGQRVAICKCSRTGRHLSTFTRQPGSDLYTLTTASAQVAESGQVAASSRVFASGQLAASCSCWVLSHQTLLFAPLPRSPLAAVSPQHALLSPCLWPSQVPALPPALACPAMPSLCRGTAVRRSSLLRVSSDHCSSTDSPYGPLGPGPCRWDGPGALIPADVSGVLIPWIRATHRQQHERFRRNFPVLRLHSDRGGEFSSDLLAEFCQDEGIRQSFTLLASPQQNGIAERRIGLVMEVARTSMIHAAAPHFLWPFVVRYATHQLNLWPCVSELETLPTLRWTGKVGDASVFRVWGTLSLVHDAKASKISSRTLRCVFLGFPTDAPPWRFYHPRLRRVFSSQDVTFDESVCFYRLHPHASHPGPAPSGVSQVDQPPLVEPLEISSDSSGPAEGDDPAADNTAATRRSPRLETPHAETAGAETEGEDSGGAAIGGAATGGVDSGGAESPSGGGAVDDPAGGSPGGGGYGPAGAGAASPRSTAGAGGNGGTAGGAGGAAGAGGTRGAAGAGDAGATSPRGATGAKGAGPTSPGGTASVRGAGGAAGAGGAGAGGTGAAGAAGPGGARTRGAGAAGAGGAVSAGGAGGTGAASTGGAGATGAGAAASGGTGGAGAAGPRGACTRGVGAAGAGCAAGAGGATGADGTRGAGGTAGARGTGAGGTGGTGGAGAPSPGGARTRGAGAAGEGGAAGAGGATRAAGNGGAGGAAGARGAGGAGARGAVGAGGATGAVGAGGAAGAGAGGAGAAGTAPRRLSPSSGTHGMAHRPSSVPQRFVLPEPPVSSLPHVPDPEFDLARAASPTVTRLLATVVTDPDFESTAAFALVTELVGFAARSRLDYIESLISESESICPPSVGVSLPLAGDLDALDIPTPRSYGEAIADEHSSQWQTAMDAEMASWKLTGTYVDEVPPPGANIVDGMWIFRVKRPPGSPPAFKARYVARGFS